MLSSRCPWLELHEVHAALSGPCFPAWPYSRRSSSMGKRGVRRRRAKKRAGRDRREQTRCSKVCASDTTAAVSGEPWQRNAFEGKEKPQHDKPIRRTKSNIKDAASLSEISWTTCAATLSCSCSVPSSATQLRGWASGSMQGSVVYGLRWLTTHFFRLCLSLACPATVRKEGND